MSAPRRTLAERPRLTVGSLFAGIGGFDLGFERAGFEIKWQVEIDPFCRAVLAKHWPDVRRYEDVRECCSGLLKRSREDGRCAVCGRRDWLSKVDVIVGGFPCQDISFAGNGDGLSGERSGLWWEFARLIRELRPRYAVVENVSALLVRGLADVLGELAAYGFDAEWCRVSACAVGAPHMRQRVFIVAYADGEHGRPRLRDSVASAFRPLQAFDGFEGARADYRARLANPSALYRDADGVPDRLERNRAIGNSVHPDIAEWIARRILHAEQEVRQL
jgi:DNA (cytosine-5)-methyltransferase 1